MQYSISSIVAPENKDMRPIQLHCVHVSSGDYCISGDYNTHSLFILNICSLLTMTLRWIPICHTLIASSPLYLALGKCLLHILHWALSCSKTSLTPRSLTELSDLLDTSPQLFHPFLQVLCEASLSSAPVYLLSVRTPRFDQRHKNFTRAPILGWLYEAAASVWS